MTQMPSPFGQSQDMPSPFGQPMGMFNQAPAPNVPWTPFNFNIGGGMGGMAGQMMLAMLAQSMGGSQYFPAQFLPTQNLWDQFQAQRYWRGQQRAMTQMENIDVANIHQTLMGAQRMMTGRAPTIQQQQQLRGMSEAIGQTMPLAATILGPEVMDMMMGPRGSATVMAQQMHRGLRSARDPFTGATGVTGRAAGLMAGEVYNQLYGPGVDINQMRGMTAGQTGALFELLQQRGLAGPDLGVLTPEERLRAIGNTDFQRRGTQRRVAEAYLRNQGQDINPTSLAAARERVFGQGGTLSQIRGGIAGGDIDAQRMMEMPGTEELLSSSQAQTISRRLKNLAGAVSAMRDIFGDMGNPNAPMREIVQGLEALTQGGISTMAPGQLEQMVRTTRNLAQTSGLGIQGMLGLQAQNANMADQLGLDRSLAVNATQQTAAWTTAARQTQRLDQPAFGRLTAEEQALLNNQIQMGGMASQTGNMLGATVRMQQEGLIQAGSNADRLAQAIMSGQTEWTDANGQRRTVAMDNAEWAQVMQGSGVTQATAESILGDEFMSQQYIRDYQLGGLTRRLQREVDIQPRVSNTFSNAMGAQINQQGVGQVLRDRMRMNSDQINALTNAASEEAASRMFDLNAETVNNTQKLNQAMAQIAEESISAQIRAQGGTEDDVQAALAAMGPVGPDGVRQGAMQMGAAMQAQLNQRIRYDPNMSGYKSFRGLWQMQNRATMVQQRAQIAEAQTTGRMQTSMAQLGRHGPVARLIAEMQNAPENRSLTDIFQRAIGSVPAGDLERTAFGGLREALQGFQGAERFTHETALQAEMDREIARRQGITATEYQSRLQKATGDQRTQMLAERDRMRQTLRDDEDFMERSRGAVNARVGTLTEKGIQQRNFNAAVMEGLNQGGQRAEAARQMIAQQVGGEGTAIGDMTAAWWKTQAEGANTPEERQRIQRMRRLDEVLQGAQAGNVTGETLKKMGLALGTQVGGEEVGAIAEMGAESQRLLGGLHDPGRRASDRMRKEYETQKKQAIEASSRFLQRAQSITETIQASTDDMQQLGREGVAAVQAAERQSAELDAMAAKASEVAGEPITAAELLAGKGPADLVREARATSKGLQTNLKRISDIKETGYVAGAGKSKVTALGKYEKKVIEAKADMLSGKSVGPIQVDPEATAAQREEAVRQAQGAYVVGELVKNLGASAAAAYGEGTVTREELAKLATDRAMPMAGALAAREQLVTIAAEQGLIKDKAGKTIGAAQVGSLTGEQRQAAITALGKRSKRQLGGDLYQQVQSLQQQQEPLAGIGRGDQEFGDLQRRIEQFREVRRPADKQDKKLSAKIAGTLTLKGDRGDVSGDLEIGDYEHNDVQTSVLGQIGEFFGLT